MGIKLDSSVSFRLKPDTIGFKRLFGQAIPTNHQVGNSPVKLALSYQARLLPMAQVSLFERVILLLKRLLVWVYLLNLSC